MIYKQYFIFTSIIFIILSLGLVSAFAFPNSLITGNVVDGGSCEGSYVLANPQSAISSSVNRIQENTSYAIDSSTNTFWSSTLGKNLPNWIYFDLGNKKCMNAINITLFNTGVMKINIQVSDDAITWTDVGSLDITEDKRSHLKTFDTFSGRYIRLNQESTTTNRFAIRDFKVQRSTFVSGQTQCIPNWVCTEWSICSSGQQSRTCADSNSCGVTSGKPSETQSCGMVCVTDAMICPDGSSVSRDPNNNCEFQQCPTTCTSTCSTNGAKECSSTGYRACAMNTAGCLEWGAVTACAADQSCSNGECLSQPAQTCSDSDKNNNERGQRTTVTDISGQQYTDYCFNNQLREAQCQTSGFGIYTTITCPAEQHCSEGMCITNQCEDTDTGDDKNKIGTVSALNGEFTDTCVNDKTVKEFYCGTDGLGKEGSRLCGDGFVCREGECRSLQCQDSDSLNEDQSTRTISDQILISGQVSTITENRQDSCVNDDSITEIFCSTNNIITETRVTCPNGFSCISDQGGARCVANECLDTDKTDSNDGKDTAIKGVVTAPDGMGEDECIGSSSSTLKEYFCKSDNTLGATSINCGVGNKCEGGKCIPLICTDEDAEEENPSLISSKAVAEGNELIDKCDGTKKVKEAICTSTGKIKHENINCESGYSCVDGACVKGCDNGFCSYNSKCYAMGIKITSSKYCDIDGDVKESKEEAVACLNNFECASNVCEIDMDGNGQCLQRGFWKNLWQRILSIFGAGNDNNDASNTNENTDNGSNQNDDGSDENEGDDDESSSSDDTTSTNPITETPESNELPSVSAQCVLGDPNSPWNIIYIDKHKDGSNGQAGADGTDLYDIDNDGDLDDTTGWEGDGKAFIYKNPEKNQANKKNAKNAEWTSTIICSDCQGVEDAHFADIDNDGYVDVVTSQQRPKKLGINWAPSNENDEWKSDKIPAATDLNLFWIVSDAGQIDGRNGIDIIAGSQSDKSGKAAIYWFEAPSDPKSISDWKAHKITSATWIMSLSLADIDNDGDLDAITSDRNKRASWFENPGDETVYNEWIEHTFGPTTDIRWAIYDDLDGDDVKEIIIADSDKKSAITWFKKGDNAKNPWTKYKVGPTAGTISPKYSKSVAVGDLNLDGNKDLVVATYEYGHKIYWMEYDTNPTDQEWNAHMIRSQDDLKFDEVQLIDMDGDGDLDIISSEQSVLGVFWFENPRYTGNCP